AHCGLPVGSYPIGQGPFFCCTGCLMVYEALHKAGFSSTYYKLQDLSPTRNGKKPANADQDSLRLAELDTNSFLEEHTKALNEQTRSIELFLDGVHCAACVWLVERLPFEMSGVHNARLDLPRARLYLEFEPEKVALSAIGQWLARFGYAVSAFHQDRSNQRSRIEQSLLIKAGICWAIAGNVMLFAFALYSGLSIVKDSSLLAGARWASFVLALIATVYGGSEFFKRAWVSMQIAMKTRDLRRLHIDTPISIGILVGFGHSAWATITGSGEIWFDSITVLIAALLTARWLQLRSRRIAGDASDQLLSMIPSMARRISTLDAADDHEVVRVDSLRKDDIIEVPAGEVFPVDGIIARGKSNVNNSVLTGESTPEPIKPGEKVQAGATNLSSPVYIRVHATGEDTRVGKLLAWIQNQESSKARVVLLADKLSSYFVLGLLALSALTALLWLQIAPKEAAHHVVALLVISCPCALGMATPLAMAIASGRAARKGIFIKSDEAIQQLTEIDTVVLDKTGTLTNGAMTLVDRTGDHEAFQLAIQLESYSNHPIAKALLRSNGVCFTDNNTVTDVESVAGQGIRGYINGHKVAAGRPAWIRSFATPNSHIESAIASYISNGYTPVAIAMDGIVVAGLAIGDKVRAEAHAILASIQAEGKQVYILSGDHSEVVHHVAEQLNIPSERAIGDASPEDKQAFIKQLQTQEGRTVAMIGDGVNDAAALKTAQVGIAVQGGATPSLVAADVFMTQDGLDTINTLFQGTHTVMRVIQRNLGISLAYNLLGATAAILGLVTPLVAAIAMPISSMIVVVSSIAQKSFLGNRRNSAEFRVQGAKIVSAPNPHTLHLAP
nr:heavy metal translocating P-type ATPase [Rhodothermaceae bacterium]